MLTILQAAPSGGGFQPLIMIGLMFVVMYFFMIRPQMRKQKAEKKFQSDMKKGDHVVTTSGIHGKVSEIDEHTCLVDTGSGKIKFERSAVSAQLTKSRYQPTLKGKS